MDDHNSISDLSSLLSRETNAYLPNFFHSGHSVVSHRSRNSYTSVQKKSKSKQFQSAAICFVLNNPVETDVANNIEGDYDRIARLVPTCGAIVYAVFQYERGESRGTVHLQGYLAVDPGVRKGKRFWRGIVGERAAVLVAKGWFSKEGNSRPDFKQRGVSIQAL